jgi:hypothetical protein
VESRGGRPASPEPNAVPTQKENPGALGAGVLEAVVSGLLAAVALQQVHRVDRNRIAADTVVFVVHDGLP